MPPVLHRGKLANPPRVLSVRPLTRDDMACLRQGNGRVVPRTQVLRATHHRLARLDAAGLRNEEILRISGYSYNRLCTLRQDPAYRELVTNYKQKVDEAYVASLDEFYETSTSNMLRAERQIEEHLDKAEDNDELIPLKTLLAITSDRADRFGYPKKKELNSNVTVDFAKRIESRMALRQGTVIDAKPNPPQGAASIIPEEPPSSGSISAVASAGRRRF